MQQVFWGILFLFLNVNLTFGSVTIGLFPDFVGYLLLLQGARTLAGRIARFSRLEPLCVGGAAYTGVLYLLNLFGVSTGLGWVAYLAALGEFVLGILAGARVVGGMEDAERAYGCSFAAAELRQAWQLSSIVGAVSCLLVPWIVPVLSIPAMLANFVCAILFLYALYRSKQLFVANDDRLHLRGEDGR